MNAPTNDPDNGVVATIVIAIVSFVVLFVAVVSTKNITIFKYCSFANIFLI